MRQPRFRTLVRSSVLAITLALASATLAVSPATAQGQLAFEPAGSSAPLFGGTVYRRGGETYDQAYARVTRAYGTLDIVRMFFPGLPKSWSKIAGDVGSTPVSVSFRTDPGAINSGRYDAQLRQWFATAPTNRPTYWTYFHEPENNTVDKAAYRQAWRHIAGLADTAGNPQLKSTLVLMCWTLDAKSGRNWRDWYAGDDVIDVMGFDCYNGGRKNGVYRDPANLLAPVAALAKSLGKPWAIPEFGTTVVTTDGGTQGRATWLRQYSSFVRDNGGAFATYFDSDSGVDYQLYDDVSRLAWRDIVQSN